MRIKKNIYIIILLLLALTGCISKKDNNKDENDVKKYNNNAVVLYFSATGTTKKIAEKIAEELNSDIVEIIPEIEYKSEDLNYNSDCRANREQNDVNARPKIKNKIDISRYDIIYLGYPIWWGTTPKIILTLIDTYDFTNKIIVPFCTSGSTDITSSVNDLRNYNPNLNIKDGKRFSLNDNDKNIKSFLDDNKIENTNNKGVKSVKAIIDGKEYIIELEDNETSKSFVNMLPIELKMSELNNNEKYAYLDEKLPTNASNPRNINVGDVMLYQDNCLVIFFKSFETSYSYTKIGHIKNLSELNAGNVNIKIEE